MEYGDNPYPMIQSPGDGAKEEKQTMESPFVNDPYAILLKAFRKLYPDKHFVAYWDMKPDGWKEGDGYGYTQFPDDSFPIIGIYADFPVQQQVEIFAHELAHVAAGVEHEHDGVWDGAFAAIFDEYNRIAEQLMPNE